MVFNWNISGIALESHGISTGIPVEYLRGTSEIPLE